jgi:hypothetical protein
MAIGRGWGRRRFLMAAPALGLAAGGCTALREGLINPCPAEPLPPRLAGHELVRAAWDGIDAAQCWDCHVHLAGIGDGGGMVWLNPEMRTLLRPFEFAHTVLFLDGACVAAGSPQVDERYVARIVAHCATEGASRDAAQGDRETPNFTQFAQLMDDPRYRGRVFGDISAITSFRRPATLRVILTRAEWHDRLL